MLHSGFRKVFFLMLLHVEKSFHFYHSLSKDRMCCFARLKLRGGSVLAETSTIPHAFTIQLSVINESGDIRNLRVGNSCTMIELKRAVASAFATTLNNRNLYFGIVELKDEREVRDYGIQDGDMVSIGPPAELKNDPIAGLSNLRSTGQKIDLQQLQSAIQSCSPNATAENAVDRLGSPAARRRDLLLSAVPNLQDEILHPTIQMEIERSIHQANIDENMLQALEHTPEVYGRVDMLYVECEINRMPVTALVDTGAQATVMSARCAERLGILRLVDRRFQGVALGVGQCRVLGRVHVVPMRLGSCYITTSLTVLDDLPRVTPTPPGAQLPSCTVPSGVRGPLASPGEGVALGEQFDGGVGEGREARAPQQQESALEFLLGLDSFRRHQCCIDCGRDMLILAGADGARHEVPLTSRPHPAQCHPDHQPGLADSNGHPKQTAPAGPR